ncbi:MAG: hypothetical protein BMS9Abin29_0423 [Gemmatimonadota bacterium]|nr:MAG: hypothetical protein BMS9Abin29_0423 [Gemmatimonadota bacterium]
MRILHTADVHLDAAFTSHSDALRRKLRDASRTAFTRLVDHALSESVDALVIAGDLFDGDRLSFQTERMLLGELGRLTAAGIPVVYATGNHDPGRTGRRAMELRWPDGVHVARDREPVTLPVQNAAGDEIGHIVAVGHGGPRESDDLSMLFPTPTGETPRVATLHTQVNDAGGWQEHDAYAPSQLKSLKTAGYDYWALGHVHRRQKLSSTPSIHYPGNLQGRNPSESGAKGALLADVRRGAAAAVRFVSLAPIRWEDLPVPKLREAATLDDLVHQVLDAWEAAREDDGGDPGTGWIVRVDLRGATPLWQELRREENQEHLRSELEMLLRVLHVSLRVGEVHRPVDLAEHLLRTDVLGEALRLAQSIRESPGRELPFEPGELIGIGNSDTPEDYVRDLLDGIEEEILARMLEGPGQNQ